MKNMLKLRWKNRVPTLVKCERGSILIEMAFTLPILFILFAGGFEIGRYALLQMKVSRVATSVGDLVAQNPAWVTETDIDGYMDAIPHIGRPFPFDDTNVQIIITAVRADETDTSIVCWQINKMANLSQTSSIGGHDQTATLPQNLALKEGDTAIIAEVFYDYAPIVFDNIMEPQVLSNLAIYRPRLATLDVLQPSGATCS